MTDKKTVRRNMIRLRKENDLRQEDIAKRLRMPRNTYAAYEQGYAMPNIVTLSQIAEIYDISLGKLIGEEKEGEDQL